MSSMSIPLTTARDVPLLITSTALSSERRITPSWSITQLKAKLETVTGIPPASQKLSLRLPDQQQEIPIQAEDEDTVQIGRWPLAAYAEIKVGEYRCRQVLLPPDSCLSVVCVIDWHIANIYRLGPHKILGNDDGLAWVIAVGNMNYSTPFRAHKGFVHS